MNLVIHEWEATCIIPECHDAHKCNSGDLKCFIAADTIIVTAAHVLVPLGAAAIPVAYRRHAGGS